MGVNGMSLQIFQHSALTVAKSCYTVYTRALADSMMTNHSDPTLCQHQFAQNGLNDEGALKNSREAEEGLPSELTSVHLRSSENIWERNRQNKSLPARKKDLLTYRYLGNKDYQQTQKWPSYYPSKCPPGIQSKFRIKITLQCLDPKKMIRHAKKQEKR